MRYGLYLDWTLRKADAAAEYLRAQMLDPASFIYAANVGVAFCQMGQYERGIAQLKAAEQLNPRSAFTHAALGVFCYFPRDMYQDAIDELQTALAMNSNDSRFSGALAYAYARSGNKDRALMFLKQLKERDQTEDMAPAIAMAYAGLQDKNSAFEWLEKAYQRHSPECARLKMIPAFAPLRSDPRFQDLARRIGFPP